MCIRDSIITADHALAHFQGADPYGKFRIPLIIYSPGNINPKKSKLFASQIDLFPTLVKLLDLDGKYSTSEKIFLKLNKVLLWLRMGHL